MAIGKTGGFASVTAPNVDFGAMTERFVDKELARDKARQDEIKADKLAKEQAKAKAQEEKRKSLVDFNETAKITGKSLFDVSANNYLKTQKAKASEYKRLAVSTLDPKYEKLYNQAQDNMRVLVNSAEYVDTLLGRVAEGATEGLYNSDDLDRFDEFAKNIQNGEYAVSVEDGVPMVTFFDTDPNDDINNERTMSFNEFLKEPLKASKYDILKSKFIDNHEVDEEKLIGGSRSTETKKITERLTGQISNYAKRLSKDPNEFAKWYMDNKSKEEYYENRGNFKEEDFKEFEDYLIEDIKESYPSIYKEGYISRGGGSGGKDDDSKGDSTIQLITTPISGSNGLSISEGASVIYPTQPKGKGLYTKSGGVAGEKKERLVAITYDEGGLKIQVEEVFDESKTKSVKVSGGKGDSKVNVNTGTSSKSERKVKKVYLENTNKDEVSSYLSLVSSEYGDVNEIKKRLYNEFIKTSREKYGLYDGYSDEDVNDYVKNKKKEKKPNNIKPDFS